MKIGELARLAGTNVETIRYYERDGLLPVFPLLFPPWQSGALRRMLVCTTKRSIKRFSGWAR